MLLENLKDLSRTITWRYIIDRLVVYMTALVCISLPLKDDYFKPILALLVVVWVISVIFDFKKFLEVLSDRVFWIVCAFFLLIFIFGAVLTADFYDNQKYFFYFYISYLFLFIVGRFYIKMPKDEALIYNSLIVAALIAAGFGLFDAYKEGKFYFIVGEFGHYNQLAMFIGAIVSGLVGWLLLRCNKASKKVQLIYWFVFLFLFLVLLATFSRGGWVSFGVVVLLLAIRLVKENFGGWKNETVRVMFALILVSIFSAYTLLYIGSKSGRDRIERLERFDLSGREYIWEKTVSLVKEKPFGWGIEKMQNYNAHNQLLNIVYGTGLITGIYFILMIAVLFFYFRDNIYSFAGMAVIFMLTHNLVEASLLGIWNNSCLFWLVLGLFCSKGREDVSRGVVFGQK